MSKKSGSPDFNRHQSFTAAIGAQSKNLSSTKFPQRSGTALDLQVEADEEGLLLSIPKGPFQGRQVVINHNAPHSRENKMIQLRKHYVQSVKQFFDASPARRNTGDINKSNASEPAQLFKHNSAQNVNKSQLMRPSSAANKLSQSNVRALTSFLQNREVTLANQISQGDSSILHNQNRALYGNGQYSTNNNLFINKSQQQIQFTHKGILSPEDKTQQQFSSLIQMQQQYQNQAHDEDQQDVVMMMPRNYSQNNNFHFQDGDYTYHQNNYQSIEMTPINSMLNHQQQHMIAQQQLFVAPSNQFFNSQMIESDSNGQSFQIQQLHYDTNKKNFPQAIGHFLKKQNLNDTKLKPQHQYLRKSQQNQPLSNDDFEREETSNQDQLAQQYKPVLDFYNHQSYYRDLAPEQNDFFSGSSSPLIHHPIKQGATLSRQYSEASITAGKQQLNNPSKIPKAPKRQNVNENLKLTLQVDKIPEDVNFEIDPHIIMMTRQPPHPSQLLNYDDEIQTSQPQYQYDGQQEEFINYQQENNNLIYQSTTAAVAVVEPYQQIQRKNSNYQDHRANQLRDQQDQMQQQQQYSTINSAGNDPSLLGGGVHPLQQTTSSNLKHNSQQNQLNNRNLVNLAGQPQSTIIKPPLSLAQNANNIPSSSTAATAATQVGVFNHQSMGNPQQIINQNGLPAVGSSNGNGGGIHQQINNIAAGGARGDNRFSGGGGGGGGGIINQNSQPQYGQPRGGVQLGNGANQFQQSFPPPTSLTPQAYNQLGSHSGFTSSSNLPLLKESSQGQNGRVRSLNQRIEYHLEGTKTPNQQSLVNINTSQYKGHQEAQQKQTQFINNQGTAFVGQPGQPQYYQNQPLLRQLPNQQINGPSLNGAAAQFQNSSQKQMNSQFGGANGHIGQNNGGFYYPKKMKQLRRRIPDLHVSGSSDSLPQQQFEAPRSNFNSYQQSASTLDPTQVQVNFSQDSRGQWVHDPL